MKHIKKVVINYIYKPQSTSSALMISGPWGCGKTFYFQKELKKSIEEHKKHVNKMEVVYISLNGLSSLSEITDQLVGHKLNGLEKIKNTKIGKLSIGLVKSATSIGLRAFVGAKGTDFDNVKLHELLNFSNSVLCFDDLERVSHKLGIDEVLGFINRNFIEIDKPNKVIIIGDEKQIDKEKSKKYHLIKEKVIGRTLYFKPDIEVFIDLKIKNEKNNFREFLIRNKEFLKERIEQAHMINLRTILFMFDSLKTVYKEIKIEKEHHVEKVIISAVLSYSFEYKRGNINDIESTSALVDSMVKQNISYNKVWQNRVSKIVDLPLDTLNHQLKKADYDLLFYELYRHNNIYYRFLRTLYEFVVKGYLDAPLLQEEINALMSKGNPSHINALNLLGRWENLSDQRFLEAYQTVKGFIKNGKYYYTDYLRIVTLLTTFYNNKMITDFSEESLENFFIENLEGVEMQQHKNINDEEYAEHLQDDYGASIEGFSKLITALAQRRKLLFEKHAIVKSKEIFALLSKREIEKINEKDLIECIIWYPDKKEIYDSIISYMSDGDSYARLVKSFDEIRKIATDYHYKKMGIKKLISFLQKTTNNISSKCKPITNYRLNSFALYLKNLIQEQ